jgi:hypothetical protein
MKKTGIWILAFVLFIPLFARTQNEVTMPASNVPPTEKQTSHAVVSPEPALTLTSTQESSGGAPATSEAPVENEGMYLEPGWTNGEVVLTNQKVLTNIPLRYDIYHQQVQYIRNNDTLAFAKPEEVATIDMAGKKLIYTEFPDEGVVGKGYFEILSNGDTRILLHPVVKYHEERDPESNLKQDVFVRENHYYIQKPGKMPEQVEFNHKSILNVFSDKEPQVQEFIENNRYRMNTLDELQKVVAFYNSLH